MWAHYADKHKGMVIEFGPTYELFTNNDFIKVEYLPQRASYDPNVNSREEIVTMAKRKSTEWEYQKEMRLIVDLRNTFQSSIGGKPIFLKSFAVSAIKSVILGVEAPIQLEKEVELVLACSDYQHVKLQRMTLSSDSFQLNPNDLIQKCNGLSNHSIVVGYDENKKLFYFDPCPGKVIDGPTNLANFGALGDAFLVIPYEKIIPNYINSFIGYGCPQNKFWFVGMEEGGGDVMDKVHKRWQTWNARGQKQTEDLVDFSMLIGEGRWFQEPYPLQATWRRLIRFFLQYQNPGNYSIDQIRDFQRNQLGRLNDTESPCLFELMPLPSPRIDEWAYQQHAVGQLAYLADRDNYDESVMPVRTDLIRLLIETHRPEVVCFYGMEYLEQWQNIVGNKVLQLQPFMFENQNLGNYSLLDLNGTRFIVLKHPTAPGSRNTYFERLGRLIRG
jgi:hypothetical protein